MLIINIELTKETYKILCTLYKVLLEKRKDGVSKREAAVFDHDCGKKYFPEIMDRDFAHSVQELGRNGLARLYTDGGFVLTDNAVIVMEGRFKKGLGEVVDFIAKFIP